MSAVPDLETIQHFPPALQYALYAVAFILSIVVMLRGISAKPKDVGYDQGLVLLEIRRILERMERGNDGARVENAAAAAGHSDLLQGIYRLLGEMRTDASRHADENNRKLDTLTEVEREVERNTDHRSRRS